MIASIVHIISLAIIAAVVFVYFWDVERRFRTEQRPWYLKYQS